MTTLKIAAAIAVLLLASTTADARRHRPVDANGNQGGPCTVKSGKTGATARVGCAYVSNFQGYIDELENNHGSTIRFIGGIRRGHCSSGHLHPCGKAIDVCQLSRGRVDSRCHLPSRAAIAAVAARHGLFEGGQWCNHDYGHAQVGVTAGACGTTMMARSHKRGRKVNVASHEQGFVPADRFIAH